MITSQFKIKVLRDEEEKEVTVHLQEISPFKFGDIAGESASGRGQILPGTFVQLAVENELIVAPKDLLKTIEEADNGISLVGEVAREVNGFCTNPRKYELQRVEREGKGKARSVADNNKESND